MLTQDLDHDPWLDLYPNVLCDRGVYPLTQNAQQLEPYITVLPWGPAPAGRLRELDLPADTTMAQLLVHDLVSIDEDIADEMICEMTHLISDEEYPESPDGLVKFMAHFAACHLSDHRFGVYAALSHTLVFGAKWWANQGDLLVISDFQSQLEMDGYEVVAFTTDREDMSAWAMLIAEIDSDYCHSHFDECTYRMASEFFKQPE